MPNKITCSNCSNEYSTDRELPLPGASPERCPSCGTKNDPPKPDLGPHAATPDGGLDTTTPLQQPTPAVGSAPPGKVSVHVNADLWQAFENARRPGDTIEDAIQAWLRD